MSGLFLHYSAAPDSGIQYCFQQNVLVSVLIAAAVSTLAVICLMQQATYYPTKLATLEFFTCIGVSDRGSIFLHTPTILFPMICKGKHVQALLNDVSVVGQLSLSAQEIRRLQIITMRLLFSWLGFWLTESLIGYSIKNRNFGESLKGFGGFFPFVGLPSVCPLHPSQGNLILSMKCDSMEGLFDILSPPRSLRSPTHFGGKKSFGRPKLKIATRLKSVQALANNPLLTETVNKQARQKSRKKRNFVDHVTSFFIGISIDGGDWWELNAGFAV
jgi:hypothetical protein